MQDMTQFKAIDLFEPYKNSFSQRNYFLQPPVHNW